MRRAKIVATLGPSSNTIEKIQELIETGMNVCRVNMSHGTHESHKELISNIRKASKKAKKEVAILADLQGPKIRVGEITKRAQVSRQTFYLHYESKDELLVSLFDDVFSELFAF